MSTPNRVLIAEDSSVIQNLVKKILEFQNFEITAVKNGEQVVQLLEKESNLFLMLSYSCLYHSWNIFGAIKTINIGFPLFIKRSYCFP